MAKASPRQTVSWEQFLASDDDDRPLREWVGGEVVEHMAASERHQAVVLFLSHLLGLFASFFHLGRVFAGPFAMRLHPEGPAREPDLLFVSQQRLDALTPTHLEGAADLAVEVVSDDSVARDRAEKFYEYQEAGVREYWVVDPRPGRQRADFWVLGQDGRYGPVTADGAGVYRSRVIPNFWLNTAWLLADDLPDPQMTFAQVAGFPPDAVAALQRLQSEGQPGA